MAAGRTKQSDPIEVDELTLDGKRIRVRLENLPIEDVRLDPENPRIAHTFAIEMASGHGDVQEQLANKLWADKSVQELYRQVRTMQGLIERIIVRDDNIVVEGNCRTVVYRKLHERFPDDPTWKAIPARILPHDAGNREIAILLGEMHVAGKITWSAFEKAGHVYRLHKNFGLTQEEISSRLRMSKSKVNQFVRAFETMREKYVVRFPGREAIHKFSYFEELFKKPKLRDWAVDSGNIDLFVAWVGEKKLSKGLQVRKLGAILDNERAYLAFLHGGYDAAAEVLEGENPALSSALFKTMREMTKALEEARMPDILRVREGGNAATRRMVEDLTDALARFRELCELE